MRRSRSLSATVILRSVDLFDIPAPVAALSPCLFYYDVGLLTRASGYVTSVTMKCTRCKAEALLYKKFCQDCLDRQKVWAQARKVRLVKDGLCYRCGNRPPASGATQCLECQTYYIQRKAKNRNTRACTACGAPAVGNRAQCAACLGDAASKRALRTAQRRAAGRCTRCGQARDSAEFTQCSGCRKKFNDSYLRLKGRVIDHYGGCCECCKEKNRKFLTLDHVNGGGSEHRRSIVATDAGGKMYRWAVKAGFPDSLRILCFNCNCGRAINGGVCPHKEAAVNAESD
jgi:hypothetical protein